MLWLAGMRGEQSLLTRRTTTSSFDRPRAARGRITTMASVGGNAYVFFQQRWFYRYGADSYLRQTDLPDREIPVDMAGMDGRLYALISSSTAARLGPGAHEAEPATAPAFDPGDAPLSVADYDGDRWRPVATCPPAVASRTSARLRPRLCPLRGKLILVWVSDGAQRVHYAQLDPNTGRWLSTGTLGTARLTAFWVVRLDGVPTLVVATERRGGGELLSAYRLLGPPVGDQTPAWQPVAELRFSPLPDGAVLTRYLDAFAFNQHLGVLGTDPSGVAYLAFARIAATPIEQALRAQDVFTQREAAERTQSSLQMITLVIMLVVLVGLFVFRRGAMVQTVPLPPGHALALTLQRLGGWLVDFVPFAWAGAVILKLDWLEGLQQLTAWGLGAGAEAGHPPTDVLLWWSVSCAGHVVYMLMMELFTRRTVGKVLTGVRLLSETGTRPTLWQIVVRNGIRLLELMPQFWVLGLLVLLSRNRQRLGDIFARTVAVRRVAAAASTGDKNESSGDDKDRHPPGSEPPRDAP